MERILRHPGGLKSLRPSALRRPAGWVCASCLYSKKHLGLLGSRAYATTQTGPESPEEKPYYVTTPIFYVNAEPHVGHMYSMILADVMKRWHKLKGKQSLLLTGTDEHGLKIQQAALRHDTPPKQWCDAQAKKFKQLAVATNIANDFFIRTTDEDHKDAVRYFWFLLKEKGLIHTTKHQGWYCVSDETYYPESLLTRKIDPITGEMFVASIETGNAVEWTEETNYQFRLTAMKDKLLAFYEENPTFVQPRSRMEEVKAWVSNNLEDLSISRPASRLDWGIRVPDDESQTIYVWVDALINYLTKAGFPNWTPGKEERGGWPADVHIIGKDILRFHAVYWPALLMAVDLPLPKQIVTHAHWTMNGKKMSKSLGNVVNPFHALNRWGVDTMRFFMMHDGSLSNDSDYDNRIIAERYKILVGQVGNLLNRCMPKRKVLKDLPSSWNVPECVATARMRAGGVRLSEAPEKDATLIEQQKSMITEVCAEVDACMRVVDPRRALRALMELSYQSNKFITHMAPWDVAKQILEATQATDIVQLRETRAQTIYLVVEALRNQAILLQPFMPGKASELLDRLGVAKHKRTFEYVGLGKDFSFGEPEDEYWGSDRLFPPLEVDEV